jgi:hypothetical protein
MSMRTLFFDLLWQIDGYLGIPHELMHVAAYRMLGKRCAYRLGDNAVTALEPCTLDERIFCLLLPLLINLLATLLLLSIWVITYIGANYPANPILYVRVAPAWHHALLLGWFFLLTYSGMSTLDVLIVIRLLLQKMRQQPPDHAQAKQAEGQSPQ